MYVLHEELVQAIDEERRQRTPGPRPTRHRPRKRHTIAAALHHIANRIDTE